ncbi:TonB-dependent receptor [Aurantivibrio plasticivorans]
MKPNTSLAPIGVSTRRAWASALLATFMSYSISVAAQESTSFDEIIVIGEKTERSLQDTASSVSLIDEEVLNSTIYPTFADVIAEVPNVVTLSGQVPDIRGVSGNGGAGGFNSISGGANARVTTLVDGLAIPFVADLSGDAGIWDVQQVEVWRGPQSTSNGRNSIGGAVYIKTKDPSFDWDGAARVGYRNQDEYIDTSVMANIPLISDSLALRLTAQKLDAETISDPDGYVDNPPTFDLNEIDSTRLNGKLLWAPSDKMTALFTYASNDEQGDVGRILYTGTDASGREKLMYRDIDTTTDIASVKVDYQFTDSVALDVLVADMDYLWGFESYNSDQSVQELSFKEDNQTIDAKLRFGKAENVVSGFVGLAYFTREQDILSENAFEYFGDDKSESQALYGEVTFAVTDQFKIITGARVAKEEQERHFTYLPNVDGALLKNSETMTLPKLVLQYDIVEDTTVALSARKGYGAPGGAVAFSTGLYYYYDSEEVLTTEASIRSRLANGKVNISANLFHNDYDGYQALSSNRTIVNMDKTTTYGAELSLIANPTSWAEFTVGLGLLESEIKDAGSNYPGVDGNELNSAPNLTGNLGARFWFAEYWNVGFSGNYVGEYFGDLQNTDERIAGDYTLFRLQAGFNSEHWSVTAYVNNLTDEDALVTREPVGPRYPEGYVSIVDPRTSGVSVTYAF